MSSDVAQTLRDYLADRDPDEYTNLADDARFKTVKEELAKWLPEVNVDNDPDHYEPWLGRPAE